MPVRRQRRNALDCEWCKLHAKLMKSSGRKPQPIRESRMICSCCVRSEENIKRGCKNISLCTVLSQSTTEVGATCFSCIISTFLVQRPLPLVLLLPRSRIPRRSDSVISWTTRYRETLIFFLGTTKRARFYVI